MNHPDHPLHRVLRQCRRCGEQKPPSEFHQSYSVCKDCKSAERKAKYWENRDAELQRNSLWHAANKTSRVHRIAAWRSANKEKTRTYALVRAARIAENGGSVTPEEWLAVKERFGYRCLRCGATKVALVADHVLPVVKGGSSDVSNLQPLCQPCNSWKGQKHIDYRQDWEDGDV